MQKRTLIKTSALLVVLAIIAIAATAFLIRRDVNLPQAHNAANKIITIESNTSTRAIIAQLHREGVLAHEWPVMLWLKTVARNVKFKTGDYEFKSPITPLEVIRKLSRGEVATRSITIPEGYNQFEIAMKLAQPLPGMKQPPPANTEEILQLFKNTSLIADMDPKATTLEGYLFPDTYEYTSNTTRAQIVEAMVKRFRKVYTPELQSRAQALGMSTHQVVTLASLVEKEAKVDQDRELISQVYHKRLKLGMNLACDPTLIYASILAGKYKWNGIIYRSDLDRDSPYNTYKRAGLPPGPIASPGKRSLEATLNPANTDYLFFVVDVTRNDGSHKFSASSADHERAVALLRQQERQNPK